LHRNVNNTDLIFVILNRANFYVDFKVITLEEHRLQMSPLDNFIKTFPKQEQAFIAETISELWNVFCDLKRKGYLRPTLRSKPRKDFHKILRTSNGLFDVFNMLFTIPNVNGKFVYGRNKEFVEHNRKYGFNEKRYVNLLLSESLSVFMRNVELFRSCFLFVLKTTERPKKKKAKVRKEFNHKMGIGGLLIQLENICGSKGKKIKDKIDWELRNGLTHGLVWIDGWTIRYPTDITFTKINEIELKKLWEKARDQSKITQCLIELIPAWYSGDC